MRTKKSTHGAAAATKTPDDPASAADSSVQSVIATGMDHGEDANGSNRIRVASRGREGFLRLSSPGLAASEDPSSFSEGREEVLAGSAREPRCKRTSGARRVRYASTCAA